MLPRRHRAALLKAGLPILILAGCGGADVPRASAAPVELRAESLLARFPGSRDPVVLEEAAGLAVRGDTVAVLDRMAATVRLFDLSGRPIGRWGGPGAGPGELSDPVYLRFGPAGGLWVGDLSLGVVRLGPGSPTGRTALEAPGGALGFAVLSSGRLAVPTPSPERLLTVYGDEAVPIESDLPVPEDLAAFRPEQMAANARILAATETGDLLLLDNLDLRLWHLELKEEPLRVSSFREIPFPRWLTEDIEERRSRLEEALRVPAGRRATIPGFKSLHVLADGRLWLVPASETFLGVLLSPDDPERARAVRRARDADGLRLDPPWDATLVGDLLVLLYETEVRVVRLTQVEE